MRRGGSHATEGEMRGFRAQVPRSAAYSRWGRRTALVSAANQISLFLSDPKSESTPPRGSPIHGNRGPVSPKAVAPLERRQRCPCWRRPHPLIRGGRGRHCNQYFGSSRQGLAALGRRFGRQNNSRRANQCHSRLAVFRRTVPE
jgi:hypothetical protein